MAEKGKRRRRKFTAELKRDAVELVRTTGRPIAYVAAERAAADGA
jgi:transposase-like protein